MDNTWLLEDVDVENSESESNSEKEYSELEERLNGIIHHSSRCEPLAPEIAKHFLVQRAEDGGVIVELKKSLEEIKSEENKNDCNKLGNIINLDDSSIDEVSPNNNTYDEDCVEVVAVVENVNKKEPQQSFKRFRYSDVNDVNSIDNIDQNEINYFKIEKGFFKNRHNRKFRRIVIPKIFNCLTDNNSINSSDWKANANKSFISIKACSNQSDDEIMTKMVTELKKVNPDKGVGRLRSFARTMFYTNVKSSNDKEKFKCTKSFKNNINNEAISLHYSNRERSQTPCPPLKVGNTDNENKINGNISTHHSTFTLNISTPNKSLDSTSDVVDLTSIDTSFTNECKPSSNSVTKGIPKKWTKKMIKYYTTPSKSKMELDVSEIIENLRNTSVAEDWLVDPQDLSGSYPKAKKMKLTGGRKCINCKDFGHFIRDCPKPKKILTCTLCGEFYHTDYTCPNTICRKCGICIPKNLNDSLDSRGLCEVCYRSEYESPLVCHVCGQYTHYTGICTDSWRRFHSTTNTDSEIIIPEVKNENTRKYCCNCAREGHFCHQCTNPGDKTCPIVTNYSNSTLDLGSTEVSYPHNFRFIFNHPDFDRFLEDLSITTSTAIYYSPNNTTCILRVHGTMDKCMLASTEIETYVETKKRKRHEPCFSRKRQRIE